jgi:hypothetical protein
LRFKRASNGTLWREGGTGNSVRCWATHGSQQFETNAEDKCQIMFTIVSLAPTYALL